MPGWPDLVIGVIVLFFAWKGFRNGFVAELAGPIAVLVAIAAAVRYPGSLDEPVAAATHLGSGSSHAVGTIVFAAIAYAAVTVTAWLIGRVAALPGIGLLNAVAGTALGAFKALLGVWLVLYITLFFPLTPDLRDDFHRSPLVQLVTVSQHQVDGTMRMLIPWFIQPLATPFFARHHA